VIYIVTSYENDCDYCVTGHSGLSIMMEIPDDIVSAIRNGQAIGDSKLNTLQNFVKEVMNTKGYVREESLKEFFEAGYSKANVLEVVLVLTQKVMSNYIGHITNVLIDEAFMPFKWKK